jgi:hypothetical protein
VIFQLNPCSRILCEKLIKYSVPLIEFFSTQDFRFLQQCKYNVSILLGCDTASLGNWCLTFWDNIVVSSSGVKCLVTSGASYPLIWCHIPEEWIPNPFITILTWTCHLNYLKPNESILHPHAMCLWGLF